MSFESSVAWVNAVSRCGISVVVPPRLPFRGALFGVIVVWLGGVVGCTPTPRVSSYHQRCLECALRRSANPLEVAEAYAYFSEGCEAGDARSCSVLGVMVEQGRGVPADSSRALRLYRFACAGGNTDACVNVGRLVEPGDVAGAVAAYEVACAARHPDACQRLASAKRSLHEVDVYGE